MIRHTHSHKRFATRTEIIISLLVFIALTFFFFFTFLNICFENIVTHPPIPLMVFAFAILVIDLLIDVRLNLTILSWDICKNSIIIVFLILSWLLTN